MTATPFPVNVVPLAYTPRSFAKRLGCSRQRVLDLIADDEVPAYMMNGRHWIPRWYVA
jgi:excisionase family DNA binding protein